MSRFHDFHKNVVLSADKRTGRARYIGDASEWIERSPQLFSDSPLTSGIIFTVKLSDSLAIGCDFLPVVLGVTTTNPAALSGLPDRASHRPGSCLVVCGDGNVSHDGALIGTRSDLILDKRDPTEVGLRWTSTGDVHLVQEGVDKGVAFTGVTGPVWAVVCPVCKTISIVSPEIVTNPQCLPSPVTYKTDSRPRGYAVVVNNYDVFGRDERLGSEKDVVKIKQMLTKLHFEVNIFVNISAQDIRDELRATSKRNDMRSRDCLIVVLMSHGGPGYIRGADGEKLDLEKTYWQFSNNGCPAMKGKPKLFFIQACSGSLEDNGVQADADPQPEKVPVLPVMSDMLVAQAAIKGYKSWRHPATGSRFIQSLVEEFEEHAADLDVARMMGRVNGRVQAKGTIQKQCPIYTSTLSKDLYLCP